MGTRPTVALFAGDPAGVGPEIVAKLLAEPETTRTADVLLIASRASMDARAQATLVEWKGLEAPAFPLGVAGPDNGRFMLDGLSTGVDLVRSGKADALCFAPLNKGALRAGGMNHPDEMHWFAEVLGWTGPCVEFNVLEDLWTSRITSHVPLKDVASLLNIEGVADGIGLLYQGLQAAGKHSPRLAVCGFNPHNGDNGNFGR